MADTLSSSPLRATIVAEERRVPSYSPLPSSIKLGRPGEGTDYARLHQEQFQAPPSPSSYAASAAFAPKGLARTHSNVPLARPGVTLDYTLASSAVLDAPPFSAEAYKRDPASIQNNVTSLAMQVPTQLEPKDWASSAHAGLLTVPPEAYVQSTLDHVAVPATGPINATSPALLKMLNRGHAMPMESAQGAILHHTIDSSHYLQATHNNAYWSPAAIAARQRPLATAAADPSAWDVSGREITRSAFPADLYVASTQLNAACAGKKGDASVRIGDPVNVKVGYVTEAMAHMQTRTEDVRLYAPGQPEAPPLARNVRYVTDHPAVSPTRRAMGATAASSSPGKLTSTAPPVAAASP